MPTETLPTRAEAPVQESVSRGFVIACLGHLAVIVGIVAFTWISHALDPHWGEADPTAGSIQASVVDALPLPPRQHFKDNEVLTSEKPSIAPTPPPPAPPTPVKAEPVKPKAEPPPKPNEILIPNKTKPVPTPTKPAEREQPVAPRRVTTPPPPTPKATTGDTGGVQIPQSITPLKNGTASLTVEDRTFGDRYAYYVRLIAQKINQQKQQDVDSPDTKGKRTAIHFTIDRDGTPTDVRVETRSGSAELDTSTMRAIERIDTFGPLPSGDHLPVTFVWDSR